MFDILTFILYLMLAVGLVAAPHFLLTSKFVDLFPGFARAYATDIPQGDREYVRLKLVAESIPLKKLLIRWDTQGYYVDEYGDFAAMPLEDGLWLRYLGPQPWSDPATMCIPWRLVNLERPVQTGARFTIDAVRTIDGRLPPELPADFSMQLDRLAPHR